VMKMTRSGERFMASFEFRVSSFESAISTLDPFRANGLPSIPVPETGKTRNPKPETRNSKL
jgi:hypothetical protein